MQGKTNPRRDRDPQDLDLGLTGWIGRKGPAIPLLAGVREFPDLDTEASGSVVVMGPGLWHQYAAETNEGQRR
jgi:hypothetical protein